VAASAVANLTHVMQPVAKAEFLEAHNQFLQQQLTARTQLGYDTLASREGIAGLNRDSREQIAQWSNERIERMAEGSNEVKIMLQNLRDQAAQARTETQTESRERVAAGAQAGATERTGMQQAGATERAGMGIQARHEDLDRRLAAQLQRLNLSMQGKQELARLNAQQKLELQQFLEQGRESRAELSAGTRMALGYLSSEDKQKLQLERSRSAMERTQVQAGAAMDRTQSQIESRELIAAAGREAAGTRQQERLTAAETKAEKDRASRERIAELRRTGNSFVKLGPDGKYEMTPADMDQALAIAQYRSKPLTTAADQKNPRSMAIMQAAREIAQKNGEAFDETGFGTHMTSRKAFTSGRQAQTIQSIGVAQDHLEALTQLTDALNRGNQPLANQIANAWATAWGRPEANNVNAAKQIIAAEVVKAITASGGGVKERLEAAGHIDPAMSPKQIYGIAQTWNALLKGQISGFERTWHLDPATKGQDFKTHFDIKEHDYSGGAGSSGWKAEEVTSKAPRIGG
jgi:hypothetical protein